MRRDSERPATTTQWRPYRSPVRRLAAIIGGFALFDFVTPLLVPKLDAEFLLPAIVGAAFVQFALIVVLGALGGEPWPIRQLQALVLVVSASWCLWVGFRLSERPRVAPAAFSGAVALMPLALLCAQTPLWALRFARGWVIERRPLGLLQMRQTRQFSILDLLLATAAVGFALGSAQFGLWLIADRVPSGELAMLIAAAAVGCALTAPACVWAALGVEEHGDGCVAMLIYLSAISLAIFLIASVVQGGGDAPAVLLVATAILGAWTLGLMHVVLLILRADGYRLHSRASAPKRSG